MARPFAHTFEDIQSPMTPSSTASSTVNTPISYKADINRKKTAKWANAKPVSYDEGWGDEDDDDYGPYPEPSTSKPTGLRQQGQAVQGTLNPEAPAVDHKKDYGELSQPPRASSSRPRANSFDADDEKRSFSSNTAPRQSPPPGAVSPPASGPATRFSQITGVPSDRIPNSPPALSVQTQQLPSNSAVTGLRKPHETMPPASVASPQDIRLAEQTNSESSSFRSPISDTRTASIDYQARQDYSPSAAPPPLSTRASPAPTSDAPAKFPPRRSSLSQSIDPDEAETPETSQETTPKPWVARAASPSGPRSPAASGKALPFIRPADIYKRRMEEEREKERQSMESSRPSIDSRTSDRSESPAARPREQRLSSESGRGRTSIEGDSVSDSGPSRPTLEPVKERKSEYGFDGFNVNNQPQSKAPGPLSTTIPDPMQSTMVVSTQKDSASPTLPTVNRFSGFGSDIFSQSKPQEPQLPAPEAKPAPIASMNSSLSPEDPTLRTQPSLGLRSAVDQAFDRKSESSLPATPTSRSQSDIQRTGSGSTGTAGISPIIGKFSEQPEASINTTMGSNSNPAGPALALAQHVDEPEVLQPPRPITEREPSFRPTLPGGWASFATTERSESPQKEEPPLAAKDDTARSSLHVASSEDDHDTTPTSTNFHVSQPTMETTTKAEAGDTIPRSDDVKNVSVSQEESGITPGGPTTDHSEAPDSKLNYEDMHPEPKSEIGKVPTPPLMNTAVSVRPADEQVPVNEPMTLQTTPILPTLTTETSPQDEESDILRKEIIQSLSPKPSDPMARDDSMLSVTSENMEESHHSNAARISSYLPSEYENYWATSTEEEHPAPVVTAPLHPVDKSIDSGDSVPHRTESEVRVEPADPVIQPLSPRKSEQSIGASRPSVPQRFSWEADPEDVSRLPIRPEPTSKVEESPPNEHVAQENRLLEPQKTETRSLSPTRGEGLSSHPVSRSPSSDSQFGRDAALAAGATAALGGVAAAGYTANQPQGNADRRFSLAEEKDPQISSYAIAPTPPEDEHPSRIVEAYLPASPDQQAQPEGHSAPSGPSKPPSTTSAVALPSQPLFSSNTKIMAFQEIAAMKLPQERIQTYNETRQRFAAIDSGLSSWVTAIKSQLPEHSDVTAWYAGSSAFGGAGGSRLAQGVPTAQSQQYLNASSSTPPGTATSRPGPGATTGTNQGFGTTTGRINTQQVQAKGKELLHTAGIFGGKAGKAGKGLLAKGKTKLQQARGGDKVD